MSRRHLFRLFAAAMALRDAYGTGRRPAPDFHLRDSRGKRWSLSDVRGKVVLLNFWATWCAPCVREIPLLNQANREYGPRGFAVLGIAMDERGWAAVTPFLSQREVDYPVLLGNAAVARSYGGLKILPQSVFLDRAGGVVATHKAVLKEEQLCRIVRALLAEPAAESAGNGAGPPR